MQTPAPAEELDLVEEEMDDAFIQELYPKASAEELPAIKIRMREGGLVRKGRKCPKKRNRWTPAQF